MDCDMISLIGLQLVHGPDSHEIVQKLQYKIPVDCLAKITSLSDEVSCDKSIISFSLTFQYFQMIFHYFPFIDNKLNLQLMSEINFKSPPRVPLG